MKRCLSLILLLALSELSFAQGNGTNAFRQVIATAPVTDTGLQQNTAILYHQVSWVDTGTVSTCTVAVDSSPDGTTWTAGGVITGQTCTTTGNSTIVNVTAQFVRVNVTALTGGGTVTFNYKGWSYNPSPGGGSGTVTSVTFTGDGTVLSSTPSSAVTTSGTVAATAATAAANTILGNFTGSIAAPTYAKVTSTQTNNSIAATGVDINTSNQVTAAHFPGAQTCTNQVVTALSTALAPTCTTITTAFTTGIAPTASPTLTGTATAATVTLKRLDVNQATTLVAGDFTLGAGWGSTASTAITLSTSKDQASVTTITTGGSGIALNPTYLLTFHDGTFTQVPACSAIQTGGNDVIADLTVTARSATAYTFQWNGTPVTGKTYEITIQCMGT